MPAFDVMNVVRRTNSEAGFQSSVKATLEGEVGLTSYNNKTYRIDSVVFEKNPSHLIPGPAITNYENKNKKRLANNWDDRK